MSKIAQKNLVESQAALARLLDFSRPRITQLKNKKVIVFNRKGQFDKSHKTNKVFIKKWELENGKPFPKEPKKPDMRRNENKKPIAPPKRKSAAKEGFEPPTVNLVGSFDDPINDEEFDLENLDKYPPAIQKLGWEIKVKKEQHEKLEIENERKRGEVLPKEQTIQTFEYVFGTIDKMLRDIAKNGAAIDVVRKVNDLKDETSGVRQKEITKIINDYVGKALARAYEIVKKGEDEVKAVEL